MKWIVIAVLALALVSPGFAHHGEVKNWSPPDNFCHVQVTADYYQNCIKAQRVIFKVFPESTRYGAMLVAKCETGNTYNRWATNPSSRTAGLFQVHPGNIGRVVWWGKHRIAISHRLYNSWENAKAALFLSQGGMNWREWDPVCHP